MTYFSGNISKAAETRTVNVGGTPTLVTDFNIAENYTTRGGERQTQFYRISMWRDAGAKLKQYLKKGRPLAVEGRVKGRGYLTQEIVDQIRATKGDEWKKLTIPCQLEMANPRITFLTANGSDEVDAEVEAPVTPEVETEVPETERPF